MTPEEGPSAEQPLQQRAGVPEVDHETVEDSPAEISSAGIVERKLDTDLSVEARVALEAHIATTFVEQAPALLTYLASSLMPPALAHGSFTSELHQRPDLDFRERILAERNAIVDLIVRSSDVAEVLRSELMGEGGADVIAEVVSSDLPAIVKEASEIFERMKVLNREILTTANEKRIKEFPGKKSVEKQLGREFASF